MKFGKFEINEYILIYLIGVIAVIVIAILS
jgi:hypothetical protein